MVGVAVPVTGLSRPGLAASLAASVVAADDSTVAVGTGVDLQVEK